MKRSSLFSCISWRSIGILTSLALLGATADAKEYIVKYRTSEGWGSVARQAAILDRHDEGRLVKINLPDRQSSIEALVALHTNPAVEYVVPNFKLSAYLKSVNLNPSALKSQWAIVKVEAEKAWNRAGNKGSRNVVVAVIDTGVDYRHSALAPNSVPGYNFPGSNSDPMDKTGSMNPGHGTHCAGIVGATGLVDGGTIGLSPEVSLMPLRFLTETGQGDLMDGIKAIDYAISKNVQVISASWGAAVPSSQAKPLVEAVDRAGKAGIVFVAAAGNDGKNNDSASYFPTNAGTDNIIAVSASGSGDAKPSWSNFGTANVDVAAPGENILSTLPGEKYGELSGTSMAAPLVSGLVALIRANDPSLTPYQIRALVQAAGDRVNIQVACDCRINAFNAMEIVKSKKMFVVPNSETIAKGATLQFSAPYGQAPFQFAVSNSQIASIDAQGLLTGNAEGDTTVTVTDSRGQTATSYKIHVGQPSGGGGGGGGGGGMEQCPFDPQTCQMLCQIMPNLPYCQ